MVVDRWVRFVAAAALPILGVVAWALRTDPPPARPQPNAAPVPSAQGAETNTNEIATLGEKALASRARGEKPPERAAATLPPADDARPAIPAAKRSDQPTRGTCGGLEARLISVGEESEWTFASVASGPGEPARLSRVGDRIGAWRVAAIDWDRVWVQSGGPRCALKLHEGLREGVEAAGDRDPTPDRAPPWQVPDSIAEAIEKRSETEYRITREALPAIFETGGGLLSGVRLVPVNKPESAMAIQLDHVPMDSLLERLGLQSGDVLLSLNGARCSTPSATLDALAQARETDRLVARLTRGGENFEIEIRVETRRM